MLKTHIEIRPNETAVLFFNIDAFPVPNASDYIWKICEHNGCSELNDGDKHILRVDGLKCTLIILDISEQDYGHYRVEVTNGIGNVLDQDFFVLKRGKFYT